MTLTKTDISHHFKFTSTATDDIKLTCNVAKFNNKFSIHQPLHCIVFVQRTSGVTCTRRIRFSSGSVILNLSAWMSSSTMQRGRYNLSRSCIINSNNNTVKPTVSQSHLSPSHVQLIHSQTYSQPVTHFTFTRAVNSQSNLQSASHTFHLYTCS